MNTRIRPSLEETFLSIAFEWSKRSTCSSRIAVGAVLANIDGRIIASGFNGSPKGFPHCDEVGCELDSDGHCKRAIHAEENVILQCAVSGISSRGNILYVTHSPCIKCCYRIIQAEIKKVVYANEYRDLPIVKSILEESGIFIRPFRLDEPWLDN